MDSERWRECLERLDLDGGSGYCRVLKLEKMGVGVGWLIVQERTDRRVRVPVHGQFFQSLRRVLALEPAGSFEREGSRVKHSAVSQIVEDSVRTLLIGRRSMTLIIWTPCTEHESPEWYHWRGERVCEADL